MRLRFCGLRSLSVSSLLFEPLLNGPVLNGIAVADELLFLNAQTFPSFTGVAVTEQLIPVEQVISRHRLPVELDVRHDTSIHFDEDAFEFLCFLCSVTQFFPEPRDFSFAIRHKVGCLLSTCPGPIQRILCLLELLLFRVHYTSPFHLIGSY